MRQRCRRLRVLVILAVLQLVASACTDLGPNPAEGPTPTPLPPPPVPEVSTYTVQRGTVVDQVVFTGRVSPVVEEELFFRTNGRVKGIYVQRDDIVEAGTLLAELENDDLLRQLAQAQIDLETTENNLQEAIEQQQYAADRASINLQITQLIFQKMLGGSEDDPDLAIARANLQKAEAAVRAAQAAYDRRAASPGVEGSPEALALEQATINLEIAQANYAKVAGSQSNVALDVEIQRLRVRLAEIELAHIEASVDTRLINAVERAKLAVERLEDQVGMTQIVSPIDGKITAAAPTVGSTVTAYKPAIIVADESELEISADITGDTLSRLTEGLPVSIVFNQYPQEEFAGTITQLPYPYGTGGGTDIREQDAFTHISYEASGITLKSGNIAQITVVLEVKDDALWLPPIAVRDFGGRRFVIVEQEGIQRRIDVTVGIESEDRLEILEGLEEGQVVLGQ